MKAASWIRRLLMLALLLVAPAPLYVGFILPAVLSPFTALSRGAEQIQLASGLLVVALWVGSLGLTLAGRVTPALKLLALAIPVQLSSFVVVALANPVLREIEREGSVRERFDAAAAAHPIQVWCNGGFAYLRQQADEAGYDVMLHRPPSEGEFALWIAQLRVSDEHRVCNASLFAERYAVASQWFDACPDTRADFEALVDRVRQPLSCPYPAIEHWPKTADTR